MDNQNSYFYQKNGDIYLSLLIQPRASRNALIGLHGDSIKIQITAPPVDAAANQAIIKFLAKQLDIPPSDLQISKGATSRRKLIRITASKNIPQLLNQIEKLSKTPNSAI